MTTAFYEAGFALFANSTLDWVADDVRVLLVSSAYTFNASHQFVSQLTNELTDASYARKILGTKSIDSSDPNTTLFLAAALSWAALAGGVSPSRLIIYKRVSTDANSPLIAALDVSGTADGTSDFNVAFGGVTPGPAIQLTRAAGVEGPAGASIRTGAGVPSSGLGADGDSYVNTTNGDVYGPKASGAWGSPTGNIRGPAGASGATWTTGSAVPDDANGSNNDLYLRTTTGDVYKKTAGTWSLLANILGPTGATGAQGPAAAPPSVVSDGGGSRNATATDFGKYTRLTSASATSITVPSGLSITDGETAVFRQAGAGLLTIVQGSGVTLNNLTGKSLVALGQGASIAITKVATNTYDLTGAFA